MDLISNWEQVKSKINKLVIFERDGANHILKVRNFSVNGEALEDPLLKQFMDTAGKLANDVLMALYGRNDLDSFPVEFREEGNYAELRFGDPKLFDTVYHLLEAIFYGDIVKDVIQGNRTAMENLLRELKHL